MKLILVLFFQFAGYILAIMSREGILWIGGLEPYMSEQFIRNALSLMGEDDALTKVKLIRNKYTGERASYGFLQVYNPR